MKSVPTRSAFPRTAAAFLFLCLFSNCAFLAVHEQVFPDSWKVRTEPSDIRSIAVSAKDALKFRLDSFFFQKSRCLKYSDGQYIYEIYDYSLQDCSTTEENETELKPDDSFPANWLPVLNADGDVMDLSSIDKYSYYLNIESAKLLYSLKPKKAEYSGKKNAVILSDSKGNCFILKREDLYGIQKASYIIVDQSIQTPEQCRTWNSSDSRNIPLVRNSRNTVVMEFQNIFRPAYSAEDGSKAVRYLRIHNVQNSPNYLYAVLYPPAIIFDIITSPFQLAYLFVIGSALPPK